MTEEKYWRVKTLDQMTNEEWEGLCDGCAKCCLNKLEDYDTGELAWTNVACALLDGQTCQCKQYPTRQSIISDCVQLTPQKVCELNWLPPTCAYRLVDEGKDLYWWHPLISGSRNTVHTSGMSVRDKTISEEGMDDEELEYHIVNWPNDDYELGEK